MTTDLPVPEFAPAGLAGVPLADVPMSTPATGADTRAALEAAGLTVGSAWTLRDVDTVEDGDAVAALAPGSRFAATWATVRRGVA